MGKYDDEFEKHGVHDSLRRVRKSLQALEGQNLPTAELLERFIAAVQFVERKLEAVDPILVTPGQLDAINAFASPAANDLEAHLKDDSGGHWSNATTRIDGLIQAALPLPHAASTRDVDGIRESVVRFRRSAGQLVSRLKQKTEGVEKDVLSLKQQAEEGTATIVAAGVTLTEKLAEFETSAKSAEAVRATTFEAESAKFATAREALVKEGRELFEASDEAWGENQAAAIDTFGLNGKAAIDKVHADLGKELGSAKDATRQALDELTDMTARAKESVGIIASTGMAGGYEKTANEEKVVADRWRRVAAGSFTGLVLIALVLAFGPLITVDELSWPAFSAKLYASLAFGLLAGYAGREAEKHRQSERQNRQRSLELRSLNPYLEPLSADQQAAIRSVVADRIFGRDYAQGQGEGEGNAGGIPTLIDVLKVLTPK